MENGGGFVGIITALCADNSPRNRAAIFSAAGLGDHQLAPREADCARKTPDISWKAFTNLFGGKVHSEWPMGTRVTGYTGNIICANKLTQPLAPTRIGEPGVILFLPDTASLDRAGKPFHVLVDSSVRKKVKLRYCGIYTRVHTMEVQIDEWHALPNKVSNPLHPYPGLESQRRCAVPQ